VAVSINWLRFHGAGSGDHRELLAAYGHAAHVDHGILRVEIAAGELEGLEDADHLIHAGQQLERLVLDGPVVADDADDGALGAL
jgi:hypothetical protein